MGKGCQCGDSYCGQEDLDTETELLKNTVDAPVVATSTPNEIEEIVFVDNISELDVIQNDAVQLAVWRQAATGTPKFMAKLQDPSAVPSSLPTFEGIVTCENVKKKLTARLCPRWKLRSKSSRALSDDEAKEFIDEIANLVRVFGEISRSDVVYVKLHLVDDNGCAYWHQDCVEFRLVKTFRGPCTQWVSPEHSKATLRRYKLNSKHAQSLSHRDVALFKGRGETAEDDDHLNQPGIVHRSPRIPEGSGTVRLVLVLDIPQEGWHY